MAMALIRQARNDPDWPQRFFGRRGLLDWPEMFESVEIPVEEFQKDGKVVIRAEAPGIDPDKDVEITMADHTVRIKVERRQETTSEDKKGYRSEFQYGSFMRAVPLPHGATDQDVKASYVDGVLEIQIPIQEPEAERKRIPIERQ